MKMTNHRTHSAFLRHVLLAAGTVLGFSALLYGAQAPPRAQAKPAPETTRAANVLRATLDNGLRVVIVRNPLAPVVTTVVNYQVGSNEAPDGFPGMAHAQEHMMFRGSPGLSADQLADISAAMGGNFDADTQQTVTQYYFTVPAEDLDVALHIESLRMKGVLDTQELWAKERGAIEQEVAQDLSNPEYVFYTKLLEAMFKGTPYAHDALGSRPSFNKTTGTMLKEFYDAWYAPNNAILVIVGDVPPAKTLSEVKELFAEIPSRKLPDRPEVNLQPVQPTALDLTTDLPYGMAVISFRMPGSDSPDFPAAQVLEDVLSSQRGSLYALVPEGKALDAGFSYDGLTNAGLGYAVAAFPKGGDGAGLVKTLRGILEKDLKDGLPAGLVEAAKRHALTDAESQRNSVAGLAMAWSQAVAVEGRNSPDEDFEAIQKVTVDDVNRVARKYLTFDDAVTAVLTPQPSGKPLSSKSFGGRESFAPTQTKQVELPEWAASAVKRVSIPASTVHPTVTTLPNGLKLIVQPESVSNTVSIYGEIKNRPDMEEPKGQEGVADVLSELFSYGTTSLDRLAFQKALDDIGADASAGTDFSLQVLASQFDRGAQLLAGNLLHPALPEKAFEIVRQQTAASLAGELQSPGYLTGRALHSALFPKDDPSLRQATPQTVSSLTMDDVKDYYSRVFRPDLTTIVVTGQVTPEQAKEVIGRYFGEWKATGPKPPTLLPPVPPNKPSVAGVPNKSRVQDQVILAETWAWCAPTPTTMRSSLAITFSAALSMPRDSSAICVRTRAWSTRSVPSSRWARRVRCTWSITPAIRRTSPRPAASCCAISRRCSASRSPRRNCSRPRRFCCGRFHSRNRVSARSPEACSRAPSTTSRSTSRPWPRAAT